jgi:hypothetical protein
LIVTHQQTCGNRNYIPFLPENESWCGATFFGVQPREPSWANRLLESWRSLNSDARCQLSFSA